MYIKTGDMVEVVAGKDSGKTGRVLRVDRKRDRIVVQGLNLVITLDSLGPRKHQCRRSADAGTQH